MNRTVGILLAAVVGTFLIVFVTILLISDPQPTPAMDMKVATDAHVPPVAGYYAGEQILFLHPEASDPEVAVMLSEMMDSPVILVPQLAEVPEVVLADVYVFADGVEPQDEPAGPFGFQADVFDTVPGSEGYSPLRNVLLVSWQEGAEPRILRSVEEIMVAQDAGDVMVERTDVVVNMPIIAWPGGRR
jgi:hypothetical protein